MRSRQFRYRCFDIASGALAPSPFGDAINSGPLCKPDADLSSLIPGYHCQPNQFCADSGYNPDQVHRVSCRLLRA